MGVEEREVESDVDGCDGRDDEGHHDDEDHALDPHDVI